MLEAKVTIRPGSSDRRRSGAAVALAFLLAGPAAAAEGPTIRIENFSFVPATLSVPAGTTVTWENGDDIPHSVVLADRLFRSKPLDTGDRTSVTFARPGTVGYFCGLHPHMQGTIIVVP